MKRLHIWIICVFMGLSFVVLLVLQSRYAASMVRMRREQFDENVFRSLDKASRDLERAETFRYLQQIMNEHEMVRPSQYQYAMGDSADVDYVDSMMHANTQGVMGLRMPRVNLMQQTVHNLQRHVQQAYAYEHELLDEVIYAVMYRASALSLYDRLNPVVLDNSIREALEGNGISMRFHYVLYAADGSEICRCRDYEEKGDEYTYTQMLFRSDPTGRMGYVRIHFPDQKEYILGAVKLVYPAMIFTFVLFITFCITVYLVVRQKRITEMKNDFVHNMTHEFKTPLSTISIAAQMMADKSVEKSSETYTRLGDVINNETQRLRFQVEKVLQMSLMEKGGVALKLQELDAHDIICNVAETFSLKVAQCGGSLETKLEAYNPFIDADEMHFTNVIFNLLDNAVKYKREEVPLQLVVRTWNNDRNLCISISDNGIGIQKEALKHIFDRFYRVHTGDRHNVKGFGLGLAYVRTMMDMHHGTIKAQSEPGKGTTFTITIKCNEE